MQAEGRAGHTIRIVRLSLHYDQHLGRTLVLSSALVALLLAPPVSLARARDAYVANYDSESVSVIDTQTKQVVGSPIPVSKYPQAIAITPDGRFAYVADGGVSEPGVSVIDTQTNQVVGSPIPVGEFPHAMAITPDGRFAYVANSLSESVSVIDTQTRQVVGSPIPVSEYPLAIAITPTVGSPTWQVFSRETYR
jgi:YVTN family beta-propeller protein